MLDIVRTYLETEKRKRVQTKEIEGFLMDILGAESYWKHGGYEALAKVYQELEAEGLLRPVKASGWNGKIPALFNTYQRLTPRAELDSLLKEKLLTFYHPNIRTSYYLEHPRDYEEDEPFILKMDAFLKQDNDVAFNSDLTINERSFQLFQNEKWLASAHGKSVLGRIGLTLENLRCYPTYEPFFYYRHGRNASLQKNALIVENKDTFFSFKSLFQAGVYAWEDLAFDLLIYGEGQKIEHSFAFFGELEEYRGCVTRFYYFGDLDPKGIAIWYQLKQQYQVEIQPARLFYEDLIQQYGHVAPLRTKKQSCPKEGERAFLAYFSPEVQGRIVELLQHDRYLPQEGLNGQRLRQLSQGGEA
ncbi:Wadjet anti-phage system protein JetD domain-containing protein [Ammoniphilus sp. CFH 90114]|uniref:Wadjet anti-phage system protein JetD domain-containing protein n=1 Tax=Ammoniphilus sp. CFH 90114 TaxID=2493665 RepID=UPI00100EA177|nr:Wadjet anti-phage system protein JetD domain-containing protein [Ammoniphilus sp. CFH 90114]RXT07777.1 hypothetical protein EIZ39_10105 [Ammoniphilus sp. CFH 90114]